MSIFSRRHPKARGAHDIVQKLTSARFIHYINHMKIVLIGFMGSGKTAVGQILARQLGYDFIEMDAVVLERADFVNMQELFDAKGEQHLRDWELNLSEEWQDTDDAVISTGGGVVLNTVLMAHMKSGNGRIIFLHAPFLVLAERIKADTTIRPLFADLAESKKLFDFRLPLYQEYADIIIRTQDKTPDRIAQEILQKLDKKTIAGPAADNDLLMVETERIIRNKKL